MNIHSIRATNFPSRVHVEFDSGLILPLIADDVVILKLSKGAEIDDNLFKQIVFKSIYYMLRNSAMLQINISPKTEKILSQKIRVSLQKIKNKYDYPSDLIDYSGVIAKLCADLKDKGLLDDSDFAQYFVRKNHSKSRRQIEYLLQSAGVDRNIINQYLPTQTSQKDEVLKIIQKKHPTVSDLKDFNYKNKLTASLYRKGFTLADIKAAFDESSNNG